MEANLHFKSVIAAVMVVCAGVLVVAQGKVAKLEEVQKMLTAPKPDGAAVMAAMKQSVGPACRMCHEKYRVRDAENNWVLKPGSIGG